MNPDVQSQLDSIVANYKAGGNTPSSLGSSAPTGNDWYSQIKAGTFSVNKQPAQTQPTGNENPMVLTSLVRPAQAVVKGITDTAIAPAQQHNAENIAAMNNIATNALKLAHNTTDPNRKAALMTTFNDTIAEMRKAGVAVDDLEKSAQQLQNVKTPFGTVTPLNVDQSGGKIAENIAGTALKTISPGMSSLAGFGAIHGAGQAMEDNGSVGDVALSAAKEAIISKMIGFGLDKIGGPILSYIGSKIPETRDAAGNLIKDVAGKIGGFLDSGPSVDIGASAMNKLAQKFSSGADFVLSPTRITKAALETDTAQGIKTGLQDKFINSVKSDWEKTGGDYSKSSKILAKGEVAGKDAPQFLAERGIDPNSTIEGGKFNTADTAKAIRTDMVKPFEDVLNKSLATADQGATPINLDTWKSSAEATVNSTKNLTAGQKEGLLSRINNEFESLSRKYPDGAISRVDLNGEKGTYWTNTNFDKTDPLARQLNYSIGSGAKKAIEQATPDVNIRALNSFIGDHYDAANFLDSINGMTPKRTIGQKLTQGAIKGATTAAGEMMFGFPGGVAGYMGGKALGAGLEAMPNPLKTWVLSELKGSVPEAYTQAIDYLGQQEADRIARLALPAAGGTSGTGAVGEKGGVIPMKGEVPFEGDKAIRK